MSKAVMISIRPKLCEFIARHLKTVEIRKTRPKIETPFKCYIYCTKPNTINPHEYLETHAPDGHIYHANGKVIGEFVCDRVTFLGNIATDSWEYLSGSTHEAHKRLVTYNACMTESECIAYGGQYGWHISDLVMYDKPKELSEFYRECPGIDDVGLCYECEKAVGDEFDCGVHRELHLSRPPQSWCYVEEMQNVDIQNR